MNTPGRCVRCGKEQVIRYRLGNELLVGVCCVLLALRAAEAVLVRAAFLSRLGIRLPEDDDE